MRDRLYFSFPLIWLAGIAGIMIVGYFV